MLARKIPGRQVIPARYLTRAISQLKEAHQLPQSVVARAERSVQLIAFGARVTTAALSSQRLYLETTQVENSFLYSIVEILKSRIQERPKLRFDLINNSIIGRHA